MKTERNDFYKIEYNDRLTTTFEEEMKKDDCLNNRILSNFFIRLESGNSKINYYKQIKSYITYMIETNTIQCTSMKEITKEDISSITSSDAIRYFDQLSKTHKNSTVSTSIKMISSFYTYLENVYKLDNIINQIPKGRFKYKTNKATKHPEDKLIEELLENVKYHSKNEFSRIRNTALVELLAGSGLRVNELANLNIENLYLDVAHPYVETIRKAYYDEESTDKVYLTGSCVKYLKEWLKFRNAKNYDSNALFVNNTGKRLAIAGIRKIISYHSSQKLTPHMFRHYYVTKLYELTNDVVFVQDNVGHARGSSVTADTYIYTVEDRLDALKKL